MNTFFIWRAKPNTAFQSGSICVLITQVTKDSGLFIGVAPHGVVEEEMCLFNEFDQIPVDTPNIKEWYYGKNSY